MAEKLGDRELFAVSLSEVKVPCPVFAWALSDPGLRPARCGAGGESGDRCLFSAENPLGATWP